MPKTLHAELAARSDKEGVSLNQYIVSALARAVSDDETATVVADGGSRDRSLRTALMVNAVVVGLAAVTAIVILVVALH
jgi:hypothetical protein